MCSALPHTLHGRLALRHPVAAHIIRAAVAMLERRNHPALSLSAWSCMSACTVGLRLVAPDCAGVGLCTHVWEGVYPTYIQRISKGWSHVVWVGDTHDRPHLAHNIARPYDGCRQEHLGHQGVCLVQPVVPASYLFEHVALWVCMRICRSVYTASHHWAQAQAACLRACVAARTRTSFCQQPPGVSAYHSENQRLDMTRWCGEPAPGQ